MLLRMRFLGAGGHYWWSGLRRQGDAALGHCNRAHLPPARRVHLPAATSPLFGATATFMAAN